MTTNNDVQNVANAVMDQYKKQLNDAITGHEKLLEQSRVQLAAMVEESNQQMAKLIAEMGPGGQPQEAKPMPEVAWVPRAPGEPADHLVLNPQAVELIDKLFKAINEVLPELAKLVKKR